MKMDRFIRCFDAWRGKAAGNDRDTDDAALTALFRQDRHRLNADAGDHDAIVFAALSRIGQRPPIQIPVPDWRWLLGKPVGAALALSVMAGWFAGWMAAGDIPAVTALLEFGWLYGAGGL